MSSPPPRPSSPSLSYSIRLVIQRYRKARILINETTVVSTTTVEECEGMGEGCGEDTVPLVRSSSPSPSPISPDQNKIADTDSNDKIISSEISSQSSRVGILVYVSFSSSVSNHDASATEAETTAETTRKLQQAAKTILQLPISTTGNSVWGDGTSTVSLLQLLEMEHKKHKEKTGKQTNETSSDPSSPLSSISLLIVPQANLICKVKKNGKSIQYHDQVNKSHGKQLYESFVRTIRDMLIEHQNSLRSSSSAPQTSSNSTLTASTGVPDPSIIPLQLFRQGKYAGLYATFDETTGIPLTTFATAPLSSADPSQSSSSSSSPTSPTQDPIPLPKSQRKKLQKIYDSHVKRHTKWLLEQEQQQQQQQENETGDGCLDDAGETNTKDEGQVTGSKAGGKTPSSSSPPSTTTLDPSFVQLIAGTFGKRQGLELWSDMGPFCHVVDI